MAPMEVSGENTGGDSEEESERHNESEQPTDDSYSVASSDM